MSHRLYRCYAKVNLTLEILGRRADGYHDLASVVHTINLADDLRIDPASVLISRVEGLDIEPTANLVARAATLLSSSAGVRAGAELTLIKRIPAAAGLAGGSSDAATTLVGLNGLWGSRFGLAELSALAAQLGSDVPFFLRGGAAVMRGRGDELQPLPPLTGQWLVLSVPPHDLEDKTRRLYAALETGDFSSGAVTARTAEELASHAPTRTLVDADLFNGFARAARAVFPSLAETWSAMERLCGRPFHLSGAGPALFALAADRRDALRQKDLLEQAGHGAYATRTVKHARASIKVADESVIGYP